MQAVTLYKADMRTVLVLHFVLFYIMPVDTLHHAYQAIEVYQPEIWPMTMAWFYGSVFDTTPVASFQPLLNQ